MDFHGSLPRLSPRTASPGRYSSWQLGLVLDHLQRIPYLLHTWHLAGNLPDSKPLAFAFNLSGKSHHSFGGSNRNISVLQFRMVEKLGLDRFDDLLVVGGLREVASRGCKHGRDPANTDNPGKSSHGFTSLPIALALLVNLTNQWRQPSLLQSPQCSTESP